MIGGTESHSEVYEGQDSCPTFVLSVTTLLWPESDDLLYLGFSAVECQLPSQ